MNAVSACPGSASLQEYLLGRTPETTADTLEEHLASCPECRKLLPTILADDDFVADFRAQAGRPQPKNALLDRLADRLRGIVQTLPARQDATPPADAEGTPAPAPPSPETTREQPRSLAPPQQADEIGRLGGYRVLKVLGQGGMGVVYQAEDPKLKRLVALKVMLPSLAADEAARRRFLREAQAMAAVHHDHIVTIFQVDEDRGIPFLAMEFLQGLPMDQWLKEGRKPSTAQVLRLGREIAEGLAAAHERGLIHRDVKPGNIWLDSAHKGRVKILDFGLARAGQEDVRLTRSGAIVGTPAYMAPEQARAEKVDARSDLFSLGCVLYKLCTGVLPFAGDTTTALLMSLALDTPKTVRELNPDVPTELSDLVMRLLAKDPAQRPQTAGEVILALQTISPASAGRAAGFIPAVGTQPAGTSPAVRPDGPHVAPAPASDGRKRKPWVLAAVAAGFLAMAVVAAVIFIWHTHSRNPQPEAPAGEPLSPLALVRKPAKIPGVESWSIEPVSPAGRIRCFLSPDGSLMATHGHDGVIRVWNIIDQRLVQVWPGDGPPDPKLEAASLAWSPDGKRLASVEGGPLRVLDVASGKAIWSSSATGFWGVSWSPDGKVIATGSGDAFALWDANTGEKIDSLPLSAPHCARQMAWSPSSKMLAITDDASAGKLAEIWDTATGKLVKSLAIPPANGWNGSTLMWSHNGAALAVVRAINFLGGKADLFDTGSWKVVQSIDALPSSQGSFAKDDKTLLWPDGEWSVADGKKARPLQSERLLHLLPPEDRMSGANNSWASTWSADARYLAGEPEYGWNVWDTDTGKVVFRPPTNCYDGCSWDFSPDGNSLAQMSRSFIEGGSLRIWDLHTGRSTVVASAIQNAKSVKWSPDGNHLVVATVVSGSPGWLFDTKSWRSQAIPLHGFETLADLLTPVWSQDSKVLVGQRDADSVQIWDIESGNSKGVLKGTPKEYAGVALSPDGKWAALAPHKAEKAIQIWDVANGKKVHELDRDDDGRVWCAWSPDGKLLATNEMDSKNHCVWDPYLGQKVRTLDGPVGLRRNLSWAADGATVISDDGEGTVQRWNYRTSTELDVFRGPRPFDGVYSADRNLLSAVRTPDAATIWNVPDNRELAVLAALPREQSIAISPEGHYRGTPHADQLIVYVVRTANGQEVLTPKEFEEKYGWKNDPSRVRLWGE